MRYVGVWVSGFIVGMVVWSMVEARLRALGERKARERWLKSRGRELGSSKDLTRIP